MSYTLKLKMQNVLGMGNEGVLDSLNMPGLEKYQILLALFGRK